MPELPEVETIKRQLNLLATSKKIKEIEVLLPKIIKAPLAEFKKAVQGAKIREFDRRAKIIIIGLDNDWSLLVHLKMSGQLIYQNQKLNIPGIAKRSGAGKNQKLRKYTHIIFHFSDGSHLLFNDMRQFGYIKLVKTHGLEEFLAKEKFGPEPFDKDFTLAKFVVRLDRRPNARIKQFLMDQKNIAGIGNIYSDEILFASRVHPLRKIKDLKPTEVKNIYQNIKKILAQAIKLKGTSADLYLDAFGHEGDFLRCLKVYGREDEKCVKCKGRVKRIKIGGRSAHFCPECQR
ncbi:DNA-formamidopyrimidine glycosylase [Patescibacteria group bacterium]|nr:DNA-formamidopyrimidine glycosylase [Patescibacteria group bacterium]